MTLENCKRLLKHFEEKGMKAAAADMKANLAKRAPSAPVPPPTLPTVKGKK